MRALVPSLLVLAACGGGHKYIASPSPMMADQGAVAIASEPSSGETYAARTDSPMREAASTPLSTFSIDVDTASLANVRRMLRDGHLPPADAVRVEEMLNYYRYALPAPAPDAAIGLLAEVSASPYHPERRLIRLGLSTRPMDAGATPPRNLVFLIDTSGSMSAAGKLPLLRQALALLVERMRPVDRIALVVYAGAAGVVLESTPGSDKERILAALDRLEAGGSTNGGAGIEAAYAEAERGFDPRAVNRVILASDGDFNVGTTDTAGLIDLIGKKRASGVYLTTLGVGDGNLSDANMEALAQHGNGNYHYLDSLGEARKVLVDDAAGTLVTLARDVKVQVEFDPAQVRAYRLVGYENRLLADDDFRDDRVDAGEIGPGHQVTAVYEVEPAEGATGAALATLRVRYRLPDGAEPVELRLAVQDAGAGPDAASVDQRLTTALVGFAMLLRASPHAGAASWPLVHELARDSAGADAQRLELVGMIERAAALAGQPLADSHPRRAQ